MSVLNPDIPIAEHREALCRDGITVVEPFLDADVAERAFKDLSGPIPWELALTNEQGPMVISAAELAQMSPAMHHKLLSDVRAQARAGYSTLYYRQDLIPGDSPYLGELTAFIGSEAWVSFARELTGDQSLVRADLHATKYSEGSFLKKHDDTYTGKQRRYAFVIGLTRGWQADWGGLFNMMDESGRVTLTEVPRFNTLTIFSVPRDHFVSQVASYANQPRFACTGWLFAPDEASAD